jgi:hypothetical protein
VFNFNSRLVDSALRQLVHPEVRIDHRGPAGLRGVVWKIPPSAKADLQGVTGSLGEQFVRVPSDQRPSKSAS